MLSINVGVRGSVGREEALTSEVGGRVRGGNYELHMKLAKRLCSTVARCGARFRLFSFVAPPLFRYEIFLFKFHSKK